RQSTTRSIADQGRTIRVPVHMPDQISKRSRANPLLSGRLGRQPTGLEVADALGLPEERVRLIVEHMHRPLSLETPVGDDEGTLSQFVPDDRLPSASETAMDNQLVQKVRRLLDGLTPREAKI